MTSSILIVALTLGAPAPKEAPKEIPKLEGDWVVESISGPKDAPPGSVTFRFTADKIMILEAKRERSEDAGYTVDLKKTPAEIDINPERGVKGMTVLGIIEVKGDTMKLCFTKEGGERPKEFKGDVATQTMLMILKRAKPEK
jgi:uncharacterized protein (TIGR03067 family)